MIWVTTENGLNRYDGYSFETFNTNDGLPSDIIINVIQGKDRRIYVGTSRGLCRSTIDGFETIIDEKYGSIHQWYVTDLVKTHKGEIIAATSGGGLCKVTAEGKFRNITENISEARYCRSIIEDNHGNLWVTTDYKNILCIRSTSAGGKEDYTVIGRYSPKTDGSVAVLCKDNNNNIYVGYLSGGIYYKRPNENSFSSISSAENYSINTIAYHSGKIYAGTDGDGLFILDATDMSFKPMSLYSPDANISRSKVTSILFDNEENLWLALNQKGVFMQPHHRNLFSCQGLSPSNEDAIRQRMGGGCPPAECSEAGGVVEDEGGGVGAFQRDAEVVAALGVRRALELQRARPDAARRQIDRLRRQVHAPLLRQAVERERALERLVERGDHVQAAGAEVARDAKRDVRRLGGRHVGEDRLLVVARGRHRDARAVRRVAHERDAAVERGDVRRVDADLALVAGDELLAPVAEEIGHEARGRHDRRDARAVVVLDSSSEYLALEVAGPIEVLAGVAVAEAVRVGAEERAVRRVEPAVVALRMGVLGGVAGLVHLLPVELQAGIRGIDIGAESCAMDMVRADGQLPDLAAGDGIRHEHAAAVQLARLVDEGELHAGANGVDVAVVVRVGVAAPVAPEHGAVVVEGERADQHLVASVAVHVLAEAGVVALPAQAAREELVVPAPHALELAVA